MEEENMSVEKENFIKEKTEKYGNRKEESIKEFKKAIKGLVFIIVSAIVFMYCLLKGTYELGTFFLIIYLGFAAKLLLDINVSKLNDRKKINKTIGLQLMEDVIKTGETPAMIAKIFGEYLTDSVDLSKYLKYARMGCTKVFTIINI